MSQFIGKVKNIETLYGWTANVMLIFTIQESYMSARICARESVTDRQKSHNTTSNSKNFSLLHLLLNVILDESVHLQSEEY
jgi:phosphopentomutase